MGMEARIIVMWGVIGSSAGAVFGALSARMPIFGMIMGAVIGLAFGLFGGMMVAAEHWNAVKRITNEVSEEALASAHTRTIYVPLPYLNAFRLAEATLQVQTTATLYRSDIERGDLGASLKVPYHRGYWITHVRMKIQALDANRTQISVDCRPRNVWLHLPDFGRNLDVVHRITRFLETVSKINSSAYLNF